MKKPPAGSYLPPGVQEREKVQQGYVIKAGPGYAIPMPVEDEPWKTDEEKVKYLPLQAKEGDLANSCSQRRHRNHVRKRKVILLYSRERF